LKIFLGRQQHTAIIFLLLALAGCFGGKSPTTSFYMLSPLSPSSAGTSPATADAPIHIGLETVAIAEYLNRNEIVLNLDNTIYQMAEFNQWAEPLNDNLTRVLEINLTKLLQSHSIEVLLASQSSIPLDYRLEVDVLRLDGNLGDRVTLIAQWALLETEEDDLVLMRRDMYQEKAAGPTVRDLVLAKSRTLDQLSRDISAGIKQALANR
jgi:uncharacterized lipoprotein YmbA